MEESNIIKIRSSDGQIVEFKNEFKNLSKLVSMTEDTDEISTDISFDVLQVIKKFCEVHDYKPSSIDFKSPLKSDKLSDNIDQKSYSIMKDYFGIKPEQAENLKPLIYAAYHLDFEKFKEICLVTLGCPFYVGDTDQEIERFKQKWDINEITPEEERVIMENNKPIFDHINETFEKKMQQEEQKYLQTFQESTQNSNNISN
ncbi:hypothetical protein ABPG72_007648 [Tetrahymena utriculariae]